MRIGVLAKGISTSAKETDASGVAYFFNVEPGPLSLTAKRSSTGQVLGKASVRTRAATATALYFHPTP